MSSGLGSSSLALICASVKRETFVSTLVIAVPRSVARVSKLYQTLSYQGASLVPTCPTSSFASLPVLTRHSGLRSGFESSGLDRPGRLPHQQGLCEARPPGPGLGLRRLTHRPPDPGTVLFSTNIFLFTGQIFTERNFRKETGCPLKSIQHKLSA